MSYRILRVVASMIAINLPIGAAPAVAAATPASRITAIAAGADHTCAVTTAGAVWCWGANDHGQLGDGTAIERHRPVQVTRSGGANLTGIATISAGVAHTCAVTRTGAAWCWGANDRGQLGDGSRTERHTPVRVTRAGGANLIGVRAITASMWPGSTCAARGDGTAWCWGANGNGQLGDGSTIDRRRAVRVTRAGGANLTGVTTISAGGMHTCAGTVSGVAWCWGDNGDGELGDGTTIERHRAVRVTRSDGARLTGVTSIGAADSTGIVDFFRTCAQTGDTAWCWGGNYFGELGDGTQTDRHRAVRVTDADGSILTGLTAVSAGLNHTCAVTGTGGVKCWGLNADGQLGDGLLGYGTDSSVPVDVVGLSGGAIAIAAGGAHTCVLTTAGAAKCWGWNGSGQLGDGSTVNRSAPVDVLGFQVWIAAIAAGASHSCAITSVGGVKCWGSNAYGQLGTGTTTNSSLPVNVVGLASGIVAITAGLDNTCALTVAGGVKCWGSNRFGQLGNATATDSRVPVDVSGLSGGVRAISGHWAHTCALTAVGGIKCWGLNAYGQLGNETTTNSGVPVGVTGLARGASAVAAGDGHTCALVAALVRCWGWNYVAQLGDGSTVDSSHPVDVIGLPGGASVISAGGQHTCGLTSNGAVLCWGNNISGQLGNGAPSGGSGPVGAVGLDRDVIAVVGGGNHTCALSPGGGLTCWGFNRFGQLGFGAAMYSAVPVAVVGLGSGVASVAAGQYHTCAVTPADGGARCWGQNVDGQLGDGTTADRPTPVVVKFTP